MSLALAYIVYKSLFNVFDLKLILPGELSLFSVRCVSTSSFFLRSN